MYRPSWSCLLILLVLSHVPWAIKTLNIYHISPCLHSIHCSILYRQPLLSREWSEDNSYYLYLVATVETEPSIIIRHAVQWPARLTWSLWLLTCYRMSEQNSGEMQWKLRHQMWYSVEMFIITIGVITTCMQLCSCDRTIVMCCNRAMPTHSSPCKSQHIAGCHRLSSLAEEVD